MFFPSTRKPIALAISALALLALGTPLAAQTIYKSSDGKTTEYSDRAPKSGKAETLTVDPNQNVIPADKSPEAQALEQQHRTEDDARYQQEQQAQRNRKERIAQAEADLRAAEAALQQAQETRDGDFLGRKGIGTRPSPQRLERINGAMDNVESAKEQLEAAKYSREP
jgi:hypothetical protein